MSIRIIAASLLSLGMVVGPSGLAAEGLSGAAVQVSNRDHIKIVGSSTVYPFSTVVAENFGRTTRFKTPIVESTGSGGGLKLFCAGLGAHYPDITNASRRIKKSEIDNCAENGVTEIIEVKIGYDGIVLANSRKNPKLEVSLRDVFQALAKNVPIGEGGLQANPHQTWADINPDLPSIKIEIMGPPPTSGTRDAFVELAMEGGCNTFPFIKALKGTDKAAYKALCHTIREDGVFIEAGENDNLIVQKLNANPDAFGVFGFSFLDQNIDTVQGALVNGVEPSFERIADGAYPVSRSLYFYVKKANIGQTPGIAEYMQEYISDKASGDEGYLADRGLIPMQPAEHDDWVDKINNLEPLTVD